MSPDLIALKSATFGNAASGKVSTAHIDETGSSKFCCEETKAKWVHGEDSADFTNSQTEVHVAQTKSSRKGKQHTDILLKSPQPSASTLHA